MIASTTEPQAAGYPSIFKVSVPRLDSDFTGSGDLTAALLLAWCHAYPDRLQEAVTRCVSTVYDVLRTA